MRGQPEGEKLISGCPHLRKLNVETIAILGLNRICTAAVGRIIESMIIRRLVKVALLATGLIAGLAGQAPPG